MDGKFSIFSCPVTTGSSCYMGQNSDHVGFSVMWQGLERCQEVKT